MALLEAIEATGRAAGLAPEGGGGVNQNRTLDAGAGAGQNLAGLLTALSGAAALRGMLALRGGMSGYAAAVAANNEALRYSEHWASAEPA